MAGSLATHLSLNPPQINPPCWYAPGAKAPGAPSFMGELEEGNGERNGAQFDPGSEIGQSAGRWIPLASPHLAPDFPFPADGRLKSYPQECGSKG